MSDTAFDPAIASPAFTRGIGPVVLIDEVHHNYHTRDGRYAPFARLLERDGFVTRPLAEPWTRESLAGASVLVVANALAPRNIDFNWNLPTPSGFTADEIVFIRRWVEQGGSLLLIADHMPFPGAAAELAAAFGVRFRNGFATDRSCGADELLFTRADGTLADHPVTRGRRPGERIDAVRTFTGQAFQMAGEGRPLLTLGAGAMLLLPDTAWRFRDDTPREPAAGMLQGALLEVGQGRVAVFGEAAMFSAQVSGAERRPMGMNDPGAGQNPQFLLNVMRWLVRATGLE